ncbi:3-isopropylmalate dehydrogenase [Carboxydocella sp. ULO1]|uniref:3-isopropylmalate dehydrogenase n=2 Tax=unclassified Carboxydocella TaxID=2685367 RepID=UPI0009AEE45D|nr:3-isopropylmalate dehydrogenase [Carboxydocella sp. ULO1]AVX30350.1 3-isopropylmalate dehydrogenase [Carboxydocella thermautotrophica]GAW28891.1 3-isopropylmalate dehydrogenase [Carboxydocella sp. ULO1]
MTKLIALLPGDGIGQEIVPQGRKVLEVVASRLRLELEFEEGLIGGAAIDATGTPLPEATLDLCRRSTAILLGAVGGPKWDNLPVHLRPEAGALLPLRKQLGLYANLRPAFLFAPLAKASPLKPELIEGLDLLAVRELTGGLYFGEKKTFRREDGQETAIDTLVYTEGEIERIVRLAFELARKRRRKVTSVDKANVLESSRLWRRVAERVAQDYPDVTLEHMYVDNCAMQLVRWPKQFDVIVTENMFGDILTDQASVLAGSIGMLPSASLGGEVALYEPSHGSAPDIAGQDKANPLATILSVALMLKFSLDCEEGAKAIEQAVAEVLAEGYRTADLWEEGAKLVGCRAMGDLVAEKVAAILG